MPTELNRFESALSLIDDANAQDPNTSDFEGVTYPAELIYGRRMSFWLNRLAPGASEALRLAVRCQHLRRWDIPRSSYPMTRAGYHVWRTTLGRYHADKAGELLRAADYDEAAVARVQSLIRKERLKADPEAQTLEDVACLVFLENDFSDFAAGHDDAKVIDILRKTWRKMSDQGHEAALGLAGTLPEKGRALLRQALSGDDGPPA